MPDGPEPPWPAVSSALLAFIGVAGTNKAASAPSLRRRVVANKSFPLLVTRTALEGHKRRELFAGVEAYCMFVGYPRSGHSLVGSILDAHPEAVIAHELDALRLLRLRLRRNQIWTLILARNAEFVASGSAARIEYTYAIPGQWQGRWTTLRVIGDKKGGKSTRSLQTDPRMLDRVRRTMKVPLRVVHVTRNPFDNISTMAKRSRRTLSAAADVYFNLCADIARTRAQLDARELLELRHEDLTAQPRATITMLTRHVGLEASDEYVDVCASMLFASPHRSREEAPWTASLIDETTERMSAHEFLAGYRFDE